ncbi:MAG: V-type ATP synthase subunit F [Clostridia bacterium]|nr:V-type ATP synthase subunit F [Clostridia bacterium]
MYKIGMIGERDSVLGFMALGFAVHEANDVEAAQQLLHRLVRTEEYAVIFITEQYAMQMEDAISQYKDRPLPAIVSIPGKEGSVGFGMNNIRSAVERAVGADVLFRD